MSVGPRGPAAARPEFADGADHFAAREVLLAAGYRELGRGDWARVFVSPDGETAARVCAFDPAYRAHAEVCVAHPGQPYFQRVDYIEVLGGGGDVVFMERLWPASEAEARSLCGALGIGKALDPEADAAERWTWRERYAGDRDLAEARALLERTAAALAERLPCFGGLDVRPENVMRDRAGHLKLIDPYNVAGPELIEALLSESGWQAVAAGYRADELRRFLEIAVFEEELERPGETLLALRRRVAQLKASE